MRLRKETEIATENMPEEEILLIANVSDALAHPARVKIFRYIMQANKAMVTVCNKDLVEHFEAEGIMVKGEFGTDPWMIEQYLKQRGFKTKQIPATDQSAVTHVLTTFWNDKDTITGSAHTICLTREADGRLHSHNNYDRETYATVKDFYAKHPKVSPIVVFSVSK